MAAVVHIDIGVTEGAQVQVVFHYAGGRKEPFRFDRPICQRFIRGLEDAFFAAQRLADASGVPQDGLRLGEHVDMRIVDDAE